MDDERLAALDRLCAAATPGPWIDLMQTYFKRCLADKKEHGNRWYHGSERASNPLILITPGTYHGEPIDSLDIPRRFDKYDLHPIISLFWSTLPRRATVAVEGFMAPENTAFIVEARTALPEALAEIRRLRALLGAAPLMLEALEANEEVARLQKPFIDGINRGNTTSDEVKQEASDRLGAAQRHWWDLRGRALRAARQQAAEGGQG